jgi:hypothetical protein
VGLTTNTQTLELACRHCGARVTLHPWNRIQVERLFALLLMPALIPGLFFFLRARAKARAWSENPLVDGVPASGLVPPGPRARRCACSAPAACVALVRHGTWSVFLGLREDFQCPRCVSRFSVHQVRSLVVTALMAGALIGAGALVVLVPPGSAVGAARSNQGFGVVLLLGGLVSALVWVWRIAQRRAHPHV